MGSTVCVCGHVLLVMWGHKSLLWGLTFLLEIKCKWGCKLGLRLWLGEYIKGSNGWVCTRCPRSDGNTTVCVPVKGLNQRTLNFGDIWVGSTQFYSALSLFVRWKK